MGIDNQVAVAERERVVHGISPKDVLSFATQFSEKALEAVDPGSYEESTIKLTLAEISKPTTDEFRVAKISPSDHIDSEDMQKPTLGEHPGIHIIQKRLDGKYLHIYIYGGLKDPDAEGLRDNMTTHRREHDSVSQTQDVLSQKTNFRIEVTDASADRTFDSLWIEAALNSKDPSQLRVKEEQILVPPHIVKDITEKTHIATKIKQTLNQRPS